MKVTRYFHEEVLQKRPYLKVEWIEAVLANPLKKQVQADGRIRLWGYVDAMQKFVRVITLDDGTVHNAFPDRNFPKE